MWTPVVKDNRQTAANANVTNPHVVHVSAADKSVGYTLGTDAIIFRSRALGWETYPRPSSRIGVLVIKKRFLGLAVAM